MSAATTLRGDPFGDASIIVLQWQAMFLSWKGRGWMVAVSTAGCLLTSDFLSGAYFHNPHYYSQHGWPKLAALWAAAGIVQAFVPRSEEVLAGATDVSAREPFLRERDGLFFVPVKYWPLILFAAGILFYFVRD